MNDFIKRKLLTFLQDESHKIFRQDEEISEKIDRMNTILNLTKITENYDELEPILNDYFSNKADKEKWER